VTVSDDSVHRRSLRPPAATWSTGGRCDRQRRPSWPRWARRLGQLAVRHPGRRRRAGSGGAERL